MTRLCSFCSFTVRVDLAGHLQGLRGGHVRVGGGDGQDDAVGVGDVLQDELSYLNLDVLWLIADGHLTQHPDRLGRTEAPALLRSDPREGASAGRRRRRRKFKRRRRFSKRYRFRLFFSFFSFSPCASPDDLELTTWS